MRNAAITMTHEGGHVTKRESGQRFKKIRDIMCGLVGGC